MARKKKTARRARAPKSKTAKPISIAEYLRQHPEGLYVTQIPELEETGISLAGIGSEPGRLKEDLALVEIGRSIGRHERNRKSASKTVRRNLEICELRKKDRKTWSMRNLARKYGMKWQSIQNILTNEAKWRRLANRLTD